MTFRRGVALVRSVARVVQLTGALDLRNLEASGELRLDELLVSASDAVYDRLVVDGHDPERLDNPEVYERAVAFQLLGLLAAQGHLDGAEEAAVVSQRQLALADRFYEQVRPRASGRDVPRTAGEAVPVVRNVP